jgi:hypothetical protein
MAAMWMHEPNILDEAYQMVNSHKLSLHDAEPGWLTRTIVYLHSGDSP